MDEDYLCWGRLRGLVEAKKEYLEKLQMGIVEREDYICVLSDRIRSIQDGGASPAEESSAILSDGPLGSERAVEEAREAERILPEEMWDTIISNLWKKDDTWKVGLTCELFSKVALKPSKNEWLFKELFSIMVEYLDGSSILKCRFVSKSWRDTVDEFFQSHPSLLFPEQDQCSLSSIKCWPYSFMVDLRREKRLKGAISLLLKERLFERYQDIYISSPDGFNMTELEEMKDHPRNPIITRSLTIGFWNMSQKKRNLLAKEQRLLDLDKFGRFIQTVGEHFWHLCIGGSCKDISCKLEEEHFTQFLAHQLLPYLPNLRTIYFMPGITADLFEDDNVINQQPKRCVTLPDLPCLETLEFHMDHVPPGQFSVKLEKQLLTKYHAQLKRLSVFEFRLFHWNKFLEFEWSSLEELYVGDYCNDNISRLGGNLLLELEAPKLRKLTLTDVRQFSDFIRVLSLLCRKLPNLHIFRLDPNANDGRYLKEEELGNDIRCLYVCPQISILEIDIDRLSPARVTFAFLLRFPFVKEVYILGKFSQNEEIMSGNEYEIVEVKKYVRGRRMYESNIWKVMPRLETLEVERTTYTRKGFQVLVKQKAKLCPMSAL